jgi:hypothetical protein
MRLSAGVVSASLQNKIRRDGVVKFQDFATPSELSLPPIVAVGWESYDERRYGLIFFSLWRQHE